MSIISTLGHDVNDILLFFYCLYILDPILVIFLFVFFFWTLESGRGHGHRLPTLSGNSITNINIIEQHNSTTVKADGGADCNLLVHHK
jgi:hypothetical protein